MNYLYLQQQSRQNQNQETNFQLPSSTDLFLLSYFQQPMTSGHDQTKTSCCVVPLPPLINNPRVGRTRVRGIKLNMYGYQRNEKEKMKMGIFYFSFTDTHFVVLLFYLYM